MLAKMLNSSMVLDITGEVNAEEVTDKFLTYTTLPDILKHDKNTFSNLVENCQPLLSDLNFSESP